MIKTLNLYAGIGGNRKLWDTLNLDIEVTAVGINPEIAKIYQDFFPKDKVIIADAHQYLLEHYKEFDFIWSSPPCPTHSRCNYFLNVQGHIRFPDMKLYEEIIFLTHFFKGKFCVENVIPYYKPLISPQYSDRHAYWCNFNITNKKDDKGFNLSNARASTRLEDKKYVITLTNYLGINIYSYKSNFDSTEFRKILRNCVHPLQGLHIFKCAFKEKQVKLND